MLVQLAVQVPHDYKGLRVDQALHKLLPDYSRSCLSTWVRNGEVTVDGRACLPKLRLVGGEQLEVMAQIEDRESMVPTAMILPIVYEDESILILNKPAGLVVHPGAGHWEDTLLNGLIHHNPDLAHLPRAGIVHRLDKDTSGLLVVAKQLSAHAHLVDQLQKRLIKRHYIALVHGMIIAGGTIDAPIGRHRQQRLKMTVTSDGKPARTHYRVAKRFRTHTLLNVQLDTGRTHQIRVHLAHLRYPIVGDPLYSGRFKLPKQCSETLKQCLQDFTRQALHACRLSLQHPVRGEVMEWEAPLPDDMQTLLDALQVYEDEYKR